jgi:hypothetical protein
MKARTNAPESRRVISGNLAKRLVGFLCYRMRETPSSTPLPDLVVHNFIKNLFEHNELISNFVRSIATTFETSSNDLKLSTEQKRYLWQNIQKMPQIMQVLQLLVTKLKNNPDWIIHNRFMTDLGIVIDVEGLKKSIHESMIEFFKIVDDRAILCDGLPIRRRDSLSKLFRVNSKLSVCNAVAIHGDEIVMGFNLSNEAACQQVLTIIQARMAILEKQLATLQNKSSLDYDQHHFADNTELYNALADIHPTIFDESLITQALDKFFDAVFYNDEAYDEMTKRAFTQGKLKYRIVMPHLQAGVLSLMNFSSENMSQPTFHTIELERPCHSVSHVHAEQMVAYYILRILNAEKYSHANPLAIGITKLCCQSCRYNLADLPVIVRGSHGEVTECTVPLFGKLVPNNGVTPPPVRRITYAATSPPDSAEKRRAYIRMSEEVVTTVSTKTVITRRKIFFVDEQKLTEEIDETLKEEVVTTKSRKTLRISADADMVDTLFNRRNNLRLETPESPQAEIDEIETKVRKLNLNNESN